jgi:hypothetical protein
MKGRMDSTGEILMGFGEENQFFVMLRMVVTNSLLG